MTDLAALHLSTVFAKENNHNITKLKLDGNCFTTKAGEYIGEALCENPNYSIKYISFDGMCLESIGLTRIVEAAKLNQHIKRLNLGILTDDGLKSLVSLLRENESLEELSIEETSDH